MRYRLMASLGAGLGLRFGEVAGLRVGRVDLADRSLLIAEALTEVNGQVFTKSPKTRAGLRRLPLSPALLGGFRRHFTTCGLDASMMEEFVFQAPQGGPIRRTHFRSRIWVPACRTAGLAGLGFHDLRRTNATMLVASGVSVRDAQELLGHEDPRMLLGIYARATADGMRAAVDRIGDLLAHTGDRGQTVTNGDGCAMDLPWHPAVRRCRGPARPGHQLYAGLQRVEVRGIEPLASTVRLLRSAN